MSDIILHRSISISLFWHFVSILL